MPTAQKNDCSHHAEHFYLPLQGTLFVYNRMGTVHRYEAMVIEANRMDRLWLSGLDHGPGHSALLVGL
jgi:hypothetical protein